MQFLYPLILCMLGAQYAASHVMWACPAPRINQAGIKQGPCGPQPGSGYITDEPQVVLQPGPVSVMFQEVIFHRGAPFRIALSVPGEDYYEQCILLNHIPHNDNGKSGDYYAVTINIPDIDCAQCSLQVIQVMTDKIPYFLGTDYTNCTYNPNDTMNWMGDLGAQCGSDYHSCTNVRIAGNGTFDHGMCVQPDGWNMGAFKGQYDYVYGSEPGVWNGGLLIDPRAPESVRTLMDNGICSSQIAAALAGQPGSAAPPAQADTGRAGTAMPQQQMSPAVIGGVVIAAIVVVAGGFFLYKSSRRNASKSTPTSGSNKAPKAVTEAGKDDAISYVNMEQVGDKS